MARRRYTAAHDMLQQQHNKSNKFDQRGENKNFFFLNQRCRLVR